MVRLKDSVLKSISETSKTISQLCKEFEVENEFRMMRIIAELQYENKVVLEGFDKIYREDFGVIYLAKYRRNYNHE